MAENKPGLTKTVYAVILTAIITGAVVGVGTWLVVRSPPEEADVLEVYHWWTAGGEKEAMDGLVGVFNEKYPDTVIIESPVAGGAGIEFRTVIKTLVLAGEAPDTFQTPGGSGVSLWVEEDLFEPITSIWEDEGWMDVFPEGIQELVKFNGEYYAVPINMGYHNMVWYNKSIFDANGITVPDDVNTWEKLWTVSQTLEAAGVTPFALGIGPHPWPLQEVFIPALAQDPELFVKFLNGEITATELRPALDIVDRFLDFVDPLDISITWDESAGRVFAGDAAMVFLGDIGNGYFKAQGWTYGVEYGAFKAPGNDNVLNVYSDTFPLPRGAKHRANAINWLKVVGSVEGENAFCPAKGSVPPRTDAPKAPYDDFTKKVMDEMVPTNTLLPDIWGGLTEESSGTVWELLGVLADNRDTASAASAIANAAESFKTW
ncbi:MAG: ABC transporter substrate-binding protein [Candidatus Geothermarchaeales archaeon]